MIKRLTAFCLWLLLASAANAQQSVTVEKLPPLPSFATTPTFNIGTGGIAGSAPGVAPGGNNTVSVQNPALDPCQTQAHSYTPINISTSLVKVIVTGTASKKTYICSLFLFAGGADNVGVFEATTATTCATSPLAVIGGATTVATAATGLDLLANEGFNLGTSQGAIAATTVNNNDLCLATSAAVQLSGVVVTVQQ